MIMLNLGCGRYYHPSWTNVDSISNDSSVIQCDLRKGIPFGNNMFDVVYHSHLLEHFPKNRALEFICECYRVLKPQGIIRVVVPDLEMIMQNYLKWLNRSLSGDPQAEANYDWMMLELYDQVVRNVNGGETLKFIKQKDLRNKEFLIERLGQTYFDIQCPSDNRGFSQNNKRDFSFKELKIKLLRCIAGFLGVQSVLQTGIFRDSGENHLWMYDQFSLRRLLMKAKLKDIQKCTADRSKIKDFSLYGLDLINGKVRKPDSFFMEGMK